MSAFLSVPPLAPPIRSSAQRLLSVNAVSSRFGLTLSTDSAMRLGKQLVQSMEEHGRYLLDDGLLEELAMAFCDSPYLLQSDYEATLSALVEAFCDCKTQCLDRLTDEELLTFLRTRFDARGGSLDALESDLTELCHQLHFPKKGRGTL